jgi:rare lipoprotein A
MVALGGCASGGSGSMREPDGPPLRPPSGVADTPDAVPRVEPLRIGGPNKPYAYNGRLYRPITDDEPLEQSGLGTWYGRTYHGRPTSSGEIYDMYGMTAAHTTMPIPSYARVSNPANGRSVIVRVNDRGPFVKGTVIDLSYAAAARLGILNRATPVTVERLTFEMIRSGRWREQPD